MTIDEMMTEIEEVYQDVIAADEQAQPAQQPAYNPALALQRYAVTFAGLAIPILYALELFLRYFNP